MINILKNSICWNKRAIEMSFNWIFAIIAGVIILFFAIYFANNFIQTGQKTVGTVTAAQLVTVLDPMESGFGSLKKPEEIDFKNSVKTFYTCNEYNNQPFGEQTLAFSEVGINGKYGDPSDKISIKNRYVFVNDILEGDTLDMFSKPFTMGFNTGDIIAISSEDYCFVQAPDEFSDLKEISNIHFSDDFNCSGIKVCFSDKPGCDIVVNGECSEVNCDSYDFGSVVNKRQGYTMYYIGNLVYGAIFSSEDIYECNVHRLMNRFNELGKIYLDKQKILEDNGCDPSIGINLQTLMDSSQNISSSKDLLLLYDQIEQLNYQNTALSGGCRLY